MKISIWNIFSFSDFSSSNRAATVRSNISTSLKFFNLHSLKLTWPLKMGLPNRKVVFQPSIFRCYVSFREGTIICTTSLFAVQESTATHLHLQYIFTTMLPQQLVKLLHRQGPWNGRVQGSCTWKIVVTALYLQYLSIHPDIWYM